MVTTKTHLWPQDGCPSRILMVKKVEYGPPQRLGAMPRVLVQEYRYPFGWTFRKHDSVPRSLARTGYKPDRGWQAHSQLHPRITIA